HHRRPRRCRRLLRDRGRHRRRTPDRRPRDRSRPHRPLGAPMNPSNRATDRLAAVTTGRRSSWVVLLLSFLLAGLVIGLGSSVESSGDAPNSLPDDAESARAAAALEEFPGADTLPAVVVF